MKVLVLNAGSSSMKFTLFAMETESPMAKGVVERLGSDSPNLVYKRADGLKVETPVPVKNHEDAVREIVKMLVDKDKGVISDLSEIVACGHRVLMGGEKITTPKLVNEEVKDVIREYIPLGPLHNPGNLAGIEACEAAIPGVPNVAVFDTEFHQTMPPEAYLYAIPQKFYREYGIRKYGFHGTSHRYVTLASAEYLGKKVEDVNLITCHLGNGCSIAAIQNGKVIDTTMGLTPLEGLMMGGRSGDMDPAAVLKLVDLGMSTAEVDKLLNKGSGLYGVAGINSGDMRDLLAAADAGNADAQLAIRMFTRRIIKYIGAYYVLIGSVDAIVFTGGIGEYSEPTRRDVLNGLGALGVKLDSAKNDACRGVAETISAPDSRIKAIVMPTNEELMIARTVMQTVKL